MYFQSPLSLLVLLYRIRSHTKNVSCTADIANAKIMRNTLIIDATLFPDMPMPLLTQFILQVIMQQQQNVFVLHVHFCNDKSNLATFQRLQPH